MDPIVYDQPELNAVRIESTSAIHRKMLSVVLGCKPKSLLEVGAGEGKLGSMIANSGIRYVGIEPVDQPFQSACRDYPNLELIKASCYDDPKSLNLGKFDLVYSNDVVEHVYEPRRFAAFCRDHLNPGGTVICCTPDYGNYLKNLLISLLGRWDKHHDPLWDGGHIKFFSKKTLEMLFRESGFSDFRWGSIRSVRLPVIPVSIYCIATLGDRTSDRQ